jgi:hypothetical protein
MRRGKAAKYSCDLCPPPGFTPSKQSSIRRLMDDLMLIGSLPIVGRHLFDRNRTREALLLGAGDSAQRRCPISPGPRPSSLPSHRRDLMPPGESRGRDNLGPLVEMKVGDTTGRLIRVTIRTSPGRRKSSTVLALLAPPSSCRCPIIGQSAALWRSRIPRRTDMAATSETTGGPPALFSLLLTLGER